MYYTLLRLNVDDIRKVLKQEDPEVIDAELMESKSLMNVSNRVIVDVRNKIVENNIRRPTEDEIEIDYFVTKKQRNFINYTHLKFLYMAYEPKFWYWEIIETFRRLAFTCFVVMTTMSANLNVSSFAYT